ncbi:MAG: hypothetical protein V4649_15615 [Bacteroidota bacterium]
MFGKAYYIIVVLALLMLVSTGCHKNPYKSKGPKIQKHISYKNPSRDQKKRMRGPRIWRGNGYW